MGVIFLSDAALGAAKNRIKELAVTDPSGQELRELSQAVFSFTENRQKWQERRGDRFPLPVHERDGRVWLCRGPRPPDVLWLKQNGFDAVIVLQSGFSEIVNDDPYEAGHPNEVGIEEYTIKCSFITCPSLKQREEFIRLVLWLWSRGAKVYFHCMSGVDRTGVMAETFNLWVTGGAPDNSYRNWVRLGRHWWYDWWRWSFLKAKPRPHIEKSIRAFRQAAALKQVSDLTLPSPRVQEWLNAEREMEFAREVAAVINRFSVDSRCNTPDYVLADDITRSLRLSCEETRRDDRGGLAAYP